MDIYLTESGTRLKIPMNPDKIQVQDNAHMESYNILLVGGVQIPRGSEVLTIAWDGLFPGEARQNMPFVKAWQPPKTIIQQLQSWKSMGSKVRLLITETPINLDVYISSIQPVWLGGFGDCQYHLDLTQAKDLVIPTVGSNGTVNAAKTTQRSKPASPKTYTVRSGDTLYGIAKRYSGSGSPDRINELYQLNKKVIGPNKNVIYPGQVYRLPSGW